MTSTATRRGFMTSLAGGAALGAGLSWPALARAAGGVSSSVIAPGFTLIQGGGGNCLVASGAGGRIVVDSGSPAHAKAVAAAVKAAGKGDIQALFNTHWHMENTGGNEWFGKRGIPIISHENTALWMGTDFYDQQAARTVGARPPAARPSRTFYTRDEMRFGDEPVVFGHLPAAHTDGDIYIHFRESNVLAVGDALSVGHYPRMDYSTGGWIGGVADASEALLEIADEDTLIVASGGGVQRRSALQKQYDMAATLRDRFVEKIKEGMSVQDMLEAGVTSEFDAEWGNPAAFVANAYRGLWGQLKYMRIA